MLKFLRVLLICLPVVFSLSGCLESMVKPEASVDTGLETQLPPYNGPRAKVAVTDFDWNVGTNQTTIGIGGTNLSFSSSEYAGISEGLKDMLTTALVQSKRYRVLERQNIDSVKSEIGLQEDGYTDSTGIKRGAVKGADIVQANTVNPVLALQGKAAGLSIGASDGGLAGNSKIQIRGVSVLNSNNNQPIFVIDGVVIESP